MGNCKNENAAVESDFWRLTERRFPLAWKKGIARILTNHFGYTENKFSLLK